MSDCKKSNNCNLCNHLRMRDGGEYGGDAMLCYHSADIKHEHSHLSGLRTKVKIEDCYAIRGKLEHCTHYKRVSIIRMVWRCAAMFIFGVGDVIEISGEARRKGDKLTNDAAGGGIGGKIVPD